MSRTPIERVKTGHPPLDHLLKGGLPSQQITLVYGEAGTGKTTLALHAALTLASTRRRTFYLDADGSLSPTRLQQLSEAHSVDTISLVGIFSPKNFLQQTMLVENLELYLTPTVGLIVVDSINHLYRLSIRDLKQAVVLNKELNRQLAYLLLIAKTRSLPVLVTSQVRSKLDGGIFEDDIEPVATRTMEYWSMNIIRLKATSRRSVRLGTLEKYLGKKISRAYCQLKIGSNGLTETREEENSS